MGQGPGGYGRENGWQYGLVLAALLLGLGLGINRALGLEAGVAAELLLRWQGAASASALPRELLGAAWFNQAWAALALGLLGVTVIGVPLIPMILLFKAYALGFSLALLLPLGGWAALAGLLLPNLIYLALLSALAVPALNFSLYLVRRYRGGNDRHPGSSLLRYGALLLAVLAGLGLGALVEVSLAPLLLACLQKL